jgi:hypothetical protein
VVFQVFECVNCSGASARVRQALAALFQTKTGEPAGPENEGSEILQCLHYNGVKYRNPWRCFFHNPMSTRIYATNRDRVRRTQNGCRVSSLWKNDRHSYAAFWEKSDR